MLWVKVLKRVEIEELKITLLTRSNFTFGESVENVLRQVRIWCGLEVGIRFRFGYIMQ